MVLFLIWVWLAGIRFPYPVPYLLDFVLVIVNGPIAAELGEPWESGLRAVLADLAALGVEIERDKLPLAPERQPESEIYSLYTVTNSAPLAAWNKRDESLSTSRITHDFVPSTIRRLPSGNSIVTTPSVGT